MKAAGKLSDSPNRKLRCNQCSNLYVTGNVNDGGQGKLCSCGCKAWYMSRLTLIEKLLFALGIYKDADLSILQTVDAPLGGPKELVFDAWERVTEELKNGIEPTGPDGPASHRPGSDLGDRHGDGIEQ